MNYVHYVHYVHYLLYVYLVYLLDIRESVNDFFDIAVFYLDYRGDKRVREHECGGLEECPEPHQRH